MSNMSVNSLFVLKEKYKLLNNSFITIVKNSNSTAPTKLATFSAKENVHNEVVMKKMIVALEETIKVLEKRVQHIKKLQNEVKNSN